MRWTTDDLMEAIAAVGIRRGDVVFSHSNIGFFGRPADSESNVASLISSTMRRAVGDGTIVVPTFTYSFCNGEPFDPQAAPSTCGTLTEHVRRLPGATRSHDPIFSVAAVGADAERLTRDVSSECFGPDSFWDRLLAVDGWICNLNFDAGSTFLHYVERKLQVAYRFDKVFEGDLIVDGVRHPSRATYFCRPLDDPRAVPAFERFDRLARSRQVAWTAPVGRGGIVAMRAADVVDLLTVELRRDPELLVVGRNNTAANRYE